MMMMMMMMMIVVANANWFKRTVSRTRATLFTERVVNVWNFLPNDVDFSSHLSFKGILFGESIFHVFFNVLLVFSSCYLFQCMPLFSPCALVTCHAMY